MRLPDEKGKRWEEKKEVRRLAGRFYGPAAFVDYFTAPDFGRPGK